MKHTLTAIAIVASLAACTTESKSPETVAEAGALAAKASTVSLNVEGMT